MNSETKRCRKCDKLILSQSLFLHENNCQGRSNFIMRSRDFDDQNDVYMQDINIKGNNSLQEEFYHCEECDMYFDIFEKNDHILSHQYEESLNDDQSNGHNYRSIREVPSNAIRSNFRGSSGMNLNSSKGFNSSNSNPGYNRISATSNNGNVVQETTVNNGTTTTVTRVIRHPNGTLTSVSNTFSSGNNRGNNSSHFYRGNSGNNFNSNINVNINSDDEDNPFNSPFFPFRANRRIVNLNNQFGGDFEAFMNQLMQGVANANSIREHPVNDNILSLLPEIKIEDFNKLPAEKRDCVICLEKYKNEETVIILPCTHIFHTSCIKDWFKTQDTCPICKFKIDGNSVNGEN